MEQLELQKSAIRQFKNKCNAVIAPFVKIFFSIVKPEVINERVDIQGDFSQLLDKKMTYFSEK